MGAPWNYSLLVGNYSYSRNGNFSNFHLTISASSIQILTSVNDNIFREDNSVQIETSFKIFYIVTGVHHTKV